MLALAMFLKYLELSFIEVGHAEMTPTFFGLSRERILLYRFSKGTLRVDIFQEFCYAFLA